MATTEKTDLSVVEEKVALTDSTVKSTATAATGTKRGTVTKIVCKSAASWVLLGLLSIIPSNLFCVVSPRSNRFHSSSPTNHRSTVFRSMSSQLAYPSLSIHSRCGWTSGGHHVHYSIVSSSPVETANVQSDDYVRSLWHLHCCSCSAAFSVRLANRWLCLDSRGKESSSVLGWEPSCVLSSNTVSFCSRASSFVHSLPDTLLLLFVLSNNHAVGYQETLSHWMRAKIWGLDKDSTAFYSQFHCLEIDHHSSCPRRLSIETHVFTFFHHVSRRTSHRRKANFFDSNNQDMYKHTSIPQSSLCICLRMGGSLIGNHFILISLYKR